MYTLTPRSDNCLLNSDSVYSFAHTISRRGMCDERPSVAIVDMGAERGNGLIATREISRGDVLYTERAALATQIPRTGDVGLGSFSVRACQNCFRSMEPIESCQLSRSALASFPMPHLWPVLGFDFEQGEGLNPESRIHRDKYGRIHCQDCQSWFCTESCHVELTKRLSSCCTATRSVHCTYSPTQGGELQPAVVLAARMFCLETARYRNTGNHDKSCFDGFCGVASDVTALELGALRSQSSDVHYYTLETVYDKLSDVLSLTVIERESLSLPLLHEMAAKAGRNGFGILTQSPFKAYYAGLLRSAGGRGSVTHNEMMGQVAIALGSGSLERGMDRLVEQRVAPEVAALFPLTARINHSCAPNAEVRSQEFVDCHIDLVALDDITMGEEITISYIAIGAAVGSKNTSRRRRELQAKYLFSCDCHLCLTVN
jgi:SET domain